MLLNNKSDFNIDGTSNIRKNEKRVLDKRFSNDTGKIFWYETQKN